MPSVAWFLYVPMRPWLTPLYAKLDAYITLSFLLHLITILMTKLIEIIYN